MLVGVAVAVVFSNHFSCLLGHCTWWQVGLVLRGVLSNNIAAYFQMDSCIQQFTWVYCYLPFGFTGCSSTRFLVQIDNSSRSIVLS